ncbi:hypothetical protein [Actinomadura terrae]|uniref:hypothetical protein n=1 Tax=Actinomadura terrae TaxID=604353 RepID=UPI001FA7B07F|nr:hypothetical protein [Actinomadura terrae]
MPPAEGTSVGVRAPLPARLSAADGFAGPPGTRDCPVFEESCGFGPLGLPGVADGLSEGFGVLVGVGVGVGVAVSVGVGEGLGSEGLVGVGVGSGLVFVGVGVGSGLGLVGLVLVGVGSGFVGVDLVGFGLLGLGLAGESPEEDGVGVGLAATGDAADTAMTAATPAPVSTLPPIDRDRTAFTSVVRYVPS